MAGVTHRLQLALGWEAACLLSVFWCGYFTAVRFLGLELWRNHKAYKLNYSLSFKVTAVFKTRHMTLTKARIQSYCLVAPVSFFSLSFLPSLAKYVLTWTVNSLEVMTVDQIIAPLKSKQTLTSVRPGLHAFSFVCKSPSAFIATAQAIKFHIFKEQKKGGWGACLVKVIWQEN